MKEIEDIVLILSNSNLGILEKSESSFRLSQRFLSGCLGGEDIDDPEIEVLLYDKQNDKRFKGNIKLSSLPNYMFNYQLFEIRKTIRKIISGLN